MYDNCMIMMYIVYIIIYIYITVSLFFTVSGLSSRATQPTNYLQLTMKIRASLCRKVETSLQLLRKVYKLGNGAGL